MLLDSCIKYKCNECYNFFVSGRGTNTHAYTHSVSESHHVFLNLHTLKFYCLPDNYEIIGIKILFYLQIGQKIPSLHLGI